MEKVENGNVVSVHYTGKLDNGETFDSSYQREEPITFTMGEGKMISGFEDAILGMEIGQKKTVTIPSEKAYGEVNENGFTETPKTSFPEDFKLVENEMVQGMTKNGHEFIGRIHEIKEDSVVLDLNHPLAGKDIIFDIELVDIVS